MPPGALNYSWEQSLASAKHGSAPHYARDKYLLKTYYISKQTVNQGKGSYSAVNAMYLLYYFLFIGLGTTVMIHFFHLLIATFTIFKCDNCLTHVVSLSLFPCPLFFLQSRATVL